jgi:hypothetical protein
LTNRLYHPLIIWMKKIKYKPLIVIRKLLPSHLVCQRPHISRVKYNRKKIVKD